MRMIETGPNDKTDMTMDYNKSPFRIHMYGTYTINGQSRPIESYVQDGKMYDKNGPGKLGSPSRY